MLNDTVVKIIPWWNYEPFLFTIFQFLKFQFGVLHLTLYSESHAIDSSDSAQRLCIQKGQIHVVNNSFIWQPGQLWCVDIIPVFLSMHPPNSCFFFFFSSYTTSSHIFTFHCSSSPVCICCLLDDLFEALMYTGQGNILFPLSFWPVLFFWSLYSQPHPHISDSH